VAGKVRPLCRVWRALYSKYPKYNHSFSYHVPHDAHHCRPRQGECQQEFHGNWYAHERDHRHQEPDHHAAAFTQQLDVCDRRRAYEHDERVRRVTLTTKETATGTYYYRGYYAGNATYAAAASKGVKVVVS
jgi:hypothetical protein